MRIDHDKETRLNPTATTDVHRLDPNWPDHFLEGGFPCVAGQRRQYLTIVRRGRERMKALRAVICGLARDVAPCLPYTLARIERLARRFADARLVLYENDSTDSTRSILEAKAHVDSRYTILGGQQGRPRWKSQRRLDRARDMAHYRNRCLDEARLRYSDFDVLIVLDTDLPHGFSYTGIAHSFGGESWDMVGSNGIQLRRKSGGDLHWIHFDAWAFRDQGHDLPHPASEIGPRNYPRGAAPVEVFSCFGGLALYRMKALPQEVAYDGTDCEHAALHLKMRSAGFTRLFLNPNQIVLYPPQLVDSRAD